MTKTIKFRVEDGIAILGIDVPGQSMNVITEQFTNELEECVDKVLADDAITGAVICSEKPAFMAGADLRMLGGLSAMAKTATPGEIFQNSVRLNRILRKMETGGKNAKDLMRSKTKPFVAAINGTALGGGFEIPLACHYRIAADDGSVKMGLPEVMVGLLPGGGGTQRLPRLIGIQAALQFLTTGKNMSAKDGLGFGILKALAPRDELVEKAKELAKANPKAIQPWDEKGFRFPGGGGAMHPGSVQTFMAANAMAQDKTYGNYPAVQYILSSVYEGSIIPMDLAVEVESKYFTRLIVEGQAGNMIRTLFVNKTAAEKGARRPKGFDKMPTKKLGMLGAGLMGAGIAYVSAAAGMDVVLIDRDQASADKGKAYSVKLVEKAVSRRKMSKEEGEALLARITATDDYSKLENADLIIEAVFEDRALKADVTKKALAVTGDDIIFASNTSTLPISSLAEASSNPENFIGIHFFSPVEKMPLVEIITGEKTGDKATAKALDYVQQIKKTPIVVNDSRGFYTSRSFGTYVMEGYAMVAEGINPALIENAGKMLGMPVGPLAVGDEVAIDLSYKIMNQTKKDLGADYQASPGDVVVDTFVEKLERFGRKNGKGMYVYPEDGGKKYLWPGISDHFPRAAEQPTVDEVKTRLLYRQIVECARCFAENVLTTPEDGDLGAIFGWGFAPWTGGPFSHMDFIGLAAFVAEADRLAEAYGERFRVPDQLRDMAQKGASYYPAGIPAAAE
ncbi:3-hydroxyacyl-CoA dehydrogenase [Iodidimonas muriae]|uniref:enoyl-CoA hydratase n=1 Tax=Iodidimonas muriae TaxID=261467 RepID=A0ABQ2L826_9PROT|nr:3-hydroxyacyl-CoA dehydrogenase NAD-binding domain-containing protein [Iodidimonas muriae]GGO06524.1 3-hydroxyacyl-CoA dehydrogenase [Iodidimonas muriae]